MRCKQTARMDTFQDLDDLLSSFGLNCTVDSRTPTDDTATLHTDRNNGTDSEDDNDTVAASAHSLVDQYILNSPRAVARESSSGATGGAVDTDPDDPQRDLDDVVGKLRDGCGCKKQCYTNFTETVILNHILNLREMETNEKEMYVMGIMSNRKVSADKRCNDGKRNRFRYSYSFGRTEVCQPAFRVIHDLTVKVHKNLLKHMKSCKDGITPRTHGLSGKKSNNATSKEVVEGAIQYLINYAAEEGLPQPAPEHGRDSQPPIYLPSSNTKLGIYKEYKSTCQHNHNDSVGLTTFTDVWKRVLSHIKIMSPREDCCKSCEDFKEEIQQATTEESKISSTTRYHKHVQDARNERSVYEQMVQKSTEMFQQESTERNLNDVHYTFDFSQYMKLPHHSRQKGPTFFIEPRKIQMFGFRVDGYKQYNYLLDENETIGTDGQHVHGPDAVISMLDDALNRFGLGEEECCIHADNCFGQNKNRYVMAYLSWRTMTRRHKAIKYMMQLPGHTRCLIDAGFGRIKQLYRRSNDDIMDHVTEIVNKSSVSNVAVQCEEFRWRDWKAWLGDRYKKVPDISKYHCFRFSADYPGYVHMKVSAFDETEKSEVICKTHLLEMDPNDIPRELLAAGLSRKRHEYLFNRVRPLVRQQYQERFITDPHSNE